MSDDQSRVPGGSTDGGIWQVGLPGPASHAGSPPPAAPLSRSAKPMRQATVPAPRHSRAARWAALWVLPYLVLGVVWAFSNPPASAPDEPDHLIKAMAAARLDIGVPFTGSLGDSPQLVRNASIARTVRVPANLAPDGYPCSQFQPDVTAACLPQGGATGDELVERTTAVGAYPVFLYVPMGLATFAADTPARAFQLARLVSVLMSTVLLYLAVWQLARWLGRGAAVGLSLGLTPMAVFATAAVSTSGIEIMAAAAVAAVTVVATRMPAVLAERSTLVVFAVAGCALVLSRQLGIVTFALLALILLARGGWRVVWSELRRGRIAVMVSVAALGVSAAALAAWELAFDHPVNTGPPLSADAWGAFLDISLSVLHSGIGMFGWLDTPLPGPVVAVWVLLLVGMGGAAVLLGRTADRVTILLSFLAVIAVAYVTYASVFYPVGFGVQGRHLIPLFLIVPMLAGIVVAEQGAPVARRLGIGVGVLVPLAQAVSVYVNARRYAVGLDGPVLFLDEAEWAPRFGWMPWFGITAFAAVWMGVMIVRGGRYPVAVLPVPDVRGVPIAGPSATSSADPAVLPTAGASDIPPVVPAPARGVPAEHPDASHVAR